MPKDPSPYTPYYLTPIGNVKEVRINSHVPKEERGLLSNPKPKPKKPSNKIKINYPGACFHGKWESPEVAKRLIKQHEEYQRRLAEFDRGRRALEEAEARQQRKEEESKKMDLAADLEAEAEERVQQKQGRKEKRRNRPKDRQV